jgi:hypothetical protein
MPTERQLLVFEDHWPQLGDLIPGTPEGVPGCEYALVLTSEYTEMYGEGWDRVRGKHGDIPPIKVADQEAMLLCKGEPILGMARGSIRCPYGATIGLVKATGLPDPGLVPGDPALPTPTQDEGKALEAT